MKVVSDAIDKINSVVSPILITVFVAIFGSSVFMLLTFEVILKKKNISKKIRNIMSWVYAGISVMLLILWRYYNG